MRAALSVASAAAVMLVVGAGAASAAPVFNVDDTLDAPDAQLDGRCESTHIVNGRRTCTLRAAIQEAERAGSGNVHLQPFIGDYELTAPAGDEENDSLPCPITPPIPPHNSCPSNLTGDLDISGDVHIIGDGGFAADVIDGMHTTRIFDVHNGGKLDLTDVTLQNGKAEFDGATGHEHGGAIHNHGALTLVRVAVIDSTSTSPNNEWGGGGITNAGDAQLMNVTVAGNSTDFTGGGIENKGHLAMLNVTITGNSAPNVLCTSSVSRQRPHCTLFLGGGIFLAAGSTMNAANTLVAKNTSGKDCSGSGAVTSGGANLQGDGRCGFSGGFNGPDLTGDPGFDPTGFGPPAYFPLLPTSQAVDTGQRGVCANNDIRGVPRARDGNGDGVVACDTGSYELDP